MPDRRKEEVFRLILLHGGRLVRRRKHNIYRFPNGLSFVFAATPSDTRSWQNALAGLKRLLRRTA